MMQNTKPHISDHPLYVLLREEKVTEFNQRKAEGEIFEMKGLDLRGLDLREIDASHLDWTDCYFRGADLRGVDLRKTKLQGASFAGAKVSGAYLPDDVPPEEFMMSVNLGTRIRTTLRSVTIEKG